MRKADDQDLRDALSEEVEHLEPSDELWNNIYKLSVAKQEKKRNPWLKSALALGAAAAAAAVFLLSGQIDLGTGPEPPVEKGPVTLVQPLATPGETTTLPTPDPEVRSLGLPNPDADRLFVSYNHTMYWYNGESVPAGDLGDLLTLTSYSNLPEAGREVRAIKGADPVKRIAVQTDQGWFVFENLLKPLSPTSPNQ